MQANTTMINTDVIGPINVFNSIIANIGGEEIGVGPIVNVETVPAVRFGFDVVFLGYDGAPERISFGAYREITCEVCRDWLVERFRSRRYKVFPCTTMSGLEWVCLRFWVKVNPALSNSLH